MTKCFPWAAVLALFAAGCGAESLVSAPRVPIPVLFGPVDRVGGHRGEGEAVASIHAELEDFVLSTTNQTRIGNSVYVSQTTRVEHVDTGELSYQILQATDAKHDKDIRIRKVGTGAWVWIAPDLASAMRDEWCDVEATVAKEQRR